MKILQETCQRLARLIDRLVMWLDKHNKSLSCDHDPNKECPQKVGITITGAGIIGCSSKAYLGCCKCKKQLKQANNLLNT